MNRYPLTIEMFFFVLNFFPFLIDYINIRSGSGALAGSFDKSVLQISDWLTWEQNMIKIQSVFVDDVDAVRMAIEKQEVSLKFPFF